METNTENLITITPRITLNPPVLQDIEVTENGEYKADGSADGLGTVTVNVEPNNEEITVTENGEYTPSEEFDGISKVTVDVQPQINLETLNVDENGTYTPQTGVDGFGEVNVNIPAPVLDDINITENGEYNPVNDGFSKVTVDVPDPVLDDINITENGNYVSEHDGFNNVTVAVPDKPLETKNITENGTYTPSQGKYGFSKVNVNIPDKPLETKNITENGSYSPSQGIYGFSQVTVDVQPDNEELNVVQNGIYTPSANKDGFSKVNVAVPDKPLEIKNINTNGQYTPSSGYYGFSEVNVNVQPNLEEKTITENGTYTPSSGYYGFSEVNVNVETFNPPLNIVISNPTSGSSISLPLTFQWSINNLEVGETPVYYLFVDDVLVYKGNNTSYTMQYVSIEGRNHTCYIIANTETRSGFTNSITFSISCEFIYGFDIDQDIEDPTDAVTYTNDCLNFTPAGLDDNNVFQYGSWRGFIDKICRPVMLRTDGTVDYELDHTNLYKNLDGNQSDIDNINYDGNVMVEFKKVYTKVWQEGNIIKVRFCDIKLDSDFHAYAFVNDDGDEQNEFYHSMFHAISNNDKLISIANSQYDIWNTTNKSWSSDLINNMPEGYGVLAKSNAQYIQFLHILISKSRNSMYTFGYPCKNYFQLQIDNLTNGGFVGDKLNSNTNTATMSFYIQHFYSCGSSGNNRPTLLNGILTKDDVFYCKNTRPYPKYSNYNIENFINTNLKRNRTDGTPVKFSVSNGLIFPTELSNKDLSKWYTTYCYFTGSSGVNYGVLSTNPNDLGSIYGMQCESGSGERFTTFITYIRPTQSQNNS